MDAEEATPGSLFIEPVHSSHHSVTYVTRDSRVNTLVQNVDDLLIDRPSPGQHANVGGGLHELIQHDAHASVHEHGDRANYSIVGHDCAEGSGQHTHAEMMSVVE